MNHYKIQQDYSTRQQRQSPRIPGRAKVRRLPSKLKQVLFWMALGVAGGLLVNYTSNPKAVNLAGKQISTQQKADKKTSFESEKRVIQLELPASG